MALDRRAEEGKQLLEEGADSGEAAASVSGPGGDGQREPHRWSLGRASKAALIGATVLALPAVAWRFLGKASPGPEASPPEADLDLIISKAASKQDSHQCQWTSKGKNTICRIDTTDNTWNGRGSVQRRWILHDFSKCKSACESMEDCTGIEYHHGWSSHCELWTKPIGHYVTHSPDWHQGLMGNYECLAYTCIAKDACGSRPDYYCKASEPECDALVPDAGHMPNLFPNECGTAEAFDYVLHYLNDAGKAVTIEATTCFKDTTLFDTTISLFDASSDKCNQIKCNDDDEAKQNKCHQAMCQPNDSHCSPDKWINCCSKVTAEVKPDQQVLIVVSSYHNPLVPFKADKPAGFELKVTHG